jgi:pimeloyl-ACP methyl ester carboxylesterase
MRVLLRTFLSVVAAVFMSACCTSLPRVPPKQLALPAFAPEYDQVSEVSEVWHDAGRNRDVPVRLYIPAVPGKRFPVVVFSHGIGEDRDSYAYMGLALARHGFLAVHVTHAGTDRAMLKRGYRFLYRATKDPANWIARPLDVSFVLDRLAMREDADMQRVAVAGHSAGAFTAFAVAGMKTENGGDFRDPRVKVAVPMSMPRMEGVVPPGGYDAIRIPVLNLTGTCDTSLIYRTFPRHRRIPFQSTHATRQYLVTFAHVSHNSFSNREDPHHAEIAAVTVAFLRAWLLDDAGARAWFDDPGRGESLTLERK